MFRSHFRQLHKHLSFLLVGTSISVGLSTSLPPANAFPWGQVIIHGIDLVQLSNLSTKQKVALGKDIHNQVLKNYNLDSNSQTNAYVNRVGQRLARSSDCSEIPFHFYVVRDPHINAFSTTGGYVYVNTGLIKATDNEAQLAAVIGHEIGHICNNDLVNKLKDTELVQGAAAVAGVDRNTLVAAAYKLAVELPNSRQDEFNADAKGLNYLVRAGYDPHAMPAFLSKLLKQSSPPTFLSDHPGTRSRIAVLDKKIAANRY